MDASALALALAASPAALAADAAQIEKGRAEEKRNCLGCHGLRIVHSQRLPRGAWERELDKMARWGAAIDDRAALIEYLVASFGDDRPLPEPPRSRDATRTAER